VSDTAVRLLCAADYFCQMSLTYTNIHIWHLRLLCPSEAQVYYMIHQLPSHGEMAINFMVEQQSIQFLDTAGGMTTVIDWRNVTVKCTHCIIFKLFFCCLVCWKWHVRRAVQSAINRLIITCHNSHALACRMAVYR
jgi:hypothetical protein